MSANLTTNLRRAARRPVESVLGALGYELLRKHYYSPVPDLTSLPPDVWTTPSDLAGLRFDPAAGLAFLRRELASYLVEYRPARQRTSNSRDFYLENGLYGTVDAETLYAMVRRFAPTRILELGSGMSTLVIADARARNDADAHGTHLVCDPFPRPDLVGALESVAELRTISATDIPQADFTALKAGDILVVDTTHTVKTGSDVNHLILDVLPRLAPGVLVHIHDIYLPWEYPREFLVNRRFFWSEQYLFQAFLAFNEQFETLFGTHALIRLFAEEISDLIPSFESTVSPTHIPSAFWIRRTEV